MKKLICVLFTIMLVFQMAPFLSNADPEPSEYYSDVYVTDPYYDAAVYLYHQNIIAAADSGSVPRGYDDVVFGSWYYEEVDFMTALDVMNGTGSRTFSPYTELTRAMAVTMLYRLAGAPDVSGAENPFADVDAGSYYEAAVKWGAANGIVHGMSSTVFAPQQMVTREQLACFIVRYAESIQAAFLTDGELAAQKLSDEEQAETSPFALEAMQMMVSEGLYYGDNVGKMRPLATATRAEAAVVFYRLALALRQMPADGLLIVGEDCLSQSFDETNERVIRLTTEQTMLLRGLLTARADWEITEPLDGDPVYRLYFWGAEYLLDDGAVSSGFTYRAPDGTMYGLRAKNTSGNALKLLYTILNDCCPTE